MTLAVTFSSWLLALHLLSAAVLVGGNVLLWVLVVHGRNVDTPGQTLAVGRVGQIGAKASPIGAFGTIVFGVWLAIRLDHIQVWSGWVLLAIVVWFIAAAAGGRAGKEEEKAMKKAGELAAAGETGPNAELLALNRSSRARGLHAITTLAIIVILVDMIWKPGAPDLAGVVPRVGDFNVDLPLLVHVTGALVLIGGLLAGASLIAFARGNVRSLRLGYWTLLAVALPSYVVMRVGAQWIYSKEGWDKLGNDPAWIGIGFMVADIGALLVVVSLVVGGIGLRRLRSGGGTGLLKASMVISWVVLAGALVAVWAMSAKPR